MFTSCPQSYSQRRELREKLLPLPLPLREKLLPSSVSPGEKLLRLGVSLASTVPSARPHLRRAAARPPASRRNRVVAALPPLALASGRLQPGLVPPDPRPPSPLDSSTPIDFNRPPQARPRSFDNRRPSPRLNRFPLSRLVGRPSSSRTLLAFGRGPGSGSPPAARATSAAAPDPGARACWLLRRGEGVGGPAPPLPLPPAGAGCSLYARALTPRCSGGITPAHAQFIASGGGHVAIGRSRRCRVVGAAHGSGTVGAGRDCADARAYLAAARWHRAHVAEFLRSSSCALSLHRARVTLSGVRCSFVQGGAVRVQVLPGRAASAERGRFASPAAFVVWLRCSVAPAPPPVPLTTSGGQGSF